MGIYGIYLFFLGQSVCLTLVPTREKTPLDLKVVGVAVTVCYNTGRFLYFKSHPVCNATQANGTC